MFDNLIFGAFFGGAVLLGAAESKLATHTSDRAGADMARAVALTEAAHRHAPATKDPVARRIIEEMRAAKARGDGSYEIPAVTVSNEGARAITKEVAATAGPAAAAHFQASIARKGIVSTLWGR